MRKFMLGWICMGFALLAPQVCSPAAAGALVPRNALAHPQTPVMLVDGYLYHRHEHRHNYYYPRSYSHYAPRAYYTERMYFYSPPVVYLPPPVVEFSPPDAYYVDCAPARPYAYSHERRCCRDW